MPDAFLRRCIFHYIEFPGREMMKQITRAHFPDLENDMADQALDAFYWVRGLDGIRKKPSTSEVLDWIQALLLGGVRPERFQEELPFAGVLLKKTEDLALLRRRQKRS